MTTPITEPLLTVPYVGLAEFKASPTWLDLDDLIEGGVQAQQDAELYNQLLKASAQAWNFCNQPLHAHTAVEETRARADRWGRLWLHPKNFPVRSVTGVAYGANQANMTVVTLDSTTTWVEDQRGLLITLLPNNGTFLGTLQFGPVPSSGMELYVQYEYVAGYGNAVLTEATTPGVNELPVDNPLGFMPPATSLFSTTYGASIARIWDPDAEEAVTIGSSYVQGANPLVISSNTVNAHEAGAQVSEFPPEVRTAVVQYAAGLLLREDASNDMPFAGSPGPTARRSEAGGVAGGLISEAERLLMPYRRVR